MKLVRHDTLPRDAVLQQCLTVYAAAFSRPPYSEGDEAVEAFAERVCRYAARDGFRLTVVMGDGDVTGFSLSALARPGDWWRDQVAGALGPARAESWLGAMCREVVHLAVMPMAQRQGYGRALVYDLLDAPDAVSVVLSCHPWADPAQRLYLSCGFEQLLTDFRTAPEQLGYWLLARRPLRP